MAVQTSGTPTMSTRSISPSFLAFLRLCNRGQTEVFKPDEKYKIPYREDILFSDCYIPIHINALVGIAPGSGFSIVEPTRIQWFQYSYLTSCEASGSSFQTCQIQVGTKLIEMEGRHLDRIAELINERYLRKLFLPVDFENLSSDSGPPDMTWVNKLTIKTVEKIED